MFSIIQVLETVPLSPISIYSLQQFYFLLSAVYSHGNLSTRWRVCCNCSNCWSCCTLACIWNCCIYAWCKNVEKDLHLWIISYPTPDDSCLDFYASKFDTNTAFLRQMLQTTQQLQWLSGNHHDHHSSSYLECERYYYKKWAWALAWVIWIFLDIFLFRFFVIHYLLKEYYSDKYSRELQGGEKGCGGSPEFDLGCNPTYCPPTQQPLMRSEMPVSGQPLVNCCNGRHARSIPNFPVVQFVVIE